MNGLKYPLEQLMTIKKNRYDQAVKLLEAKKSELKEEEEKLKKIEKERDEVLNHKNQKLLQLREDLDRGTTSDKIKQMKDYLTVVDENLEKEEKKVKGQKEAVDKAEKQVEAARLDLFAKEKDLEKLKIHKKEWEKEVKFFTEHQEAIEHDDLGSSQHVQKQIKRKKDGR